MSSVTSTNPYANTPGVTNIQSNPIGYTTPQTKQVLNSDDFMKLLTTQLSNQDPMQPEDNTAMVSQMASFTSLAQMNQLVASFGTLTSNQTLSTATTYIGKQVTVNTGDSNNPTVTGIVTGVDASGTTPQIKIDGKSYPVTSVTEIDVAPATSTTTTTTSTTSTGA